MILGKPKLAKHNAPIDWMEGKMDIFKGQIYFVIRGEEHYASMNHEIALLEGVVACQINGP